MRRRERWEDYSPRRYRNRGQKTENTRHRKRADVEYPSVFLSFRHVGQNVSLDIGKRNYPLFAPFCPFLFLSNTTGSNLPPWSSANPPQNQRPSPHGKGPSFGLFTGFKPPGGGEWIRTIEAEATDLQSAPFDHSGTPPYSTFSKNWWSWWTDLNPRPADYKCSEGRESVAAPGFSCIFGPKSAGRVVCLRHTIRLAY